MDRLPIVFPRTEKIDSRLERVSEPRHLPILSPTPGIHLKTIETRQERSMKAVVMELSEEQKADILFEDYVRQFEWHIKRKEPTPEDSNVEVKSLRERLHAKEQSLSQIKEQLEASRQAETEWRDNFGELAFQLEKDERKATDRIRKMKLQIEEYEEEIQRKNSEMSSLSSRLMIAERKLEVLNASTPFPFQGLNHVSQLTQEFEHTIQEQSKVIAELKSKSSLSDRLEKEIRNLLEENEHLRQEIHDQSMKQAAADKGIAEIKNAFSEREQFIDQQLRQAEEAKQQLQEENKVLQKVIEGKDAALLESSHAARMIPSPRKPGKHVKALTDNVKNDKTVERYEAQIVSLFDECLNVTHEMFFTFLDNLFAEEDHSDAHIIFLAIFGRLREKYGVQFIWLCKDYNRQRFKKENARIYDRQQ